MPSSSSLKNTVNLGNSIIGVSILAMPYCFQKCGIILSSLLLLASGLLTKVTSHLLLKSAITTRRRNYEFLAFHTFGPTGKLLVEIGILGFLLGSCIAFFVVVGDLGPPLVAQFLLVEPSSRLRTGVLLLLGTCVGLPLGLLRNLESLTSFSIMSLVFYAFLIVKIFCESFSVLWSGDWWSHVVLWRHENLLSVLPIFAMALSCQPQLFEIFDTVNEPSLKRMNFVVSRAVHLCSAVYFMMGFFGYVAFYRETIPGNILVKVSPSLLSQVVKLGFIATLVVSFPLCLFPCRTSLHSLLFKRGSKHPELSHIPVGQFRALTVLLVGVTVGCAVLLPNVEVVLGLTGSSIGSLICIVMPALIFARLTSRETNERLLAQSLCCLGLFLMVTCTLTTLHTVSEAPEQQSAIKVAVPSLVPARMEVRSSAIAVLSSPSPPKIVEPPKLPPAVQVNVATEARAPEIRLEQKRVEPPEPREPLEQQAKEASPLPKLKPTPKPQNEDHGLDPEALKKEDREIEESGAKKALPANDAPLPAKQPKNADAELVVKKQETLLEKIAEEQKEQKRILEDLQNKLKEELLKHQENPPVKERAATELEKVVPNVVQEVVGKDKVVKRPKPTEPVHDSPREAVEKVVPVEETNVGKGGIPAKTVSKVVARPVPQGHVMPAAKEPPVLASLGNVPKEIVRERNPSADASLDNAAAHSKDNINPPPLPQVVQQAKVEMRSKPLAAKMGKDISEDVQLKQAQNVPIVPADAVVLTPLKNSAAEGSNGTHSALKLLTNQSAAPQSVVQGSSLEKHEIRK